MNSEITDYPVYITMKEVAKVLGWRTQRARRWLQRSGAAVKRNHRWVTTRSMLRENFPEVWDELVRALPENDN